MNQTKKEVLEHIKERYEAGAFEKGTYDLLEKLIKTAKNDDEAIQIAELGVGRKTGLNYTKKMEVITNEIQYLKKNEELSFSDVTGKENPLTHKLIIGDNYPALKNLLITYRNRIDVIYIDPPYGSDKLGNFAKTNYTNAITRDNLLSMLYPRLLLAKQLLTDDGVIFCSIDDKNQAYIKCLMDDIFGENNFVANMPRVSVKGGKSKVDTITNNCDYLLVYAKNESMVEFLKISMEGDEAFKYEDEYKDIRGKYHTKQALDTISLGYVESLDYPIVHEGKTYYPGQTPENNGFRWTWSKDKYDFAIKNDFVIFKENRVWPKKYMNCSIEKEKGTGKYYIKYMQRAKNFSQIDLIDNAYSNANGKSDFEETGLKSFKYPKPVSLIKFILSLINKKDCIVLDFFAGSGTTGQGVLSLNAEDGGNRTFILCTNNEIESENPNGIAYDVTTKRLKRVMTGECYDGTKDYKWNKKNKPFGDNLEVYEIDEISTSVSKDGLSPIDAIDESCYGKHFNNIQEKIDWICNNFQKLTKRLED